RTVEQGPAANRRGIARHLKIHRGLARTESGKSTESERRWKLRVAPIRLEPLGLELVAEACRRSGFEVRLLDLQTSKHNDYFRTIEQWRPDALGFSLNYLANVPEVIDLAKATRERWPEKFVFAGGHGASFVAREILEHGAGAIDCVVKGEGEGLAPRLL